MKNSTLREDALEATRRGLNYGDYTALKESGRIQKPTEDKPLKKLGHRSHDNYGTGRRKM